MLIRAASFPVVRLRGPRGGALIAVRAGSPQGRWRLSAITDEALCARLEALVGRLVASLGVIYPVPRPDLWVVPDVDEEKAQDDG